MRLTSKTRVFAAAAAVATAGGLLGARAVMSQGTPPGPPPCKPGERLQVLRKEQADVLKRIGRFRVLRGPADLAALARPPENYVFLAHQFTSFRDIGLTIIDPFDTPRQGVPNLIFYAPNPKAADTTHPTGPDFPYTFVGWAYGVPYTPGVIPPLVPCLRQQDWIIHERGVHPESDGSMYEMPPAETYYGQSPGSFTDPPAMQPVIGFPHPRSWTAHFWYETSGTPVIAPLDPLHRASGIDPRAGADFYPPENPPKG